MILAHHAIFSMYGFWLPNDPRGSGSDYVASPSLLKHGKATKTDSRRSVAAVAHDQARRKAAKSALRYPPVSITGRQALSVVEGFALACREGGYVVHACAVLPDHVHLVIAAHERPIRQVIGHLKSRATLRLKQAGQWDDGRPLWGAHGWNVPLETAVAVERAVRYVEENPTKEGKKRQRWSFVTAFDTKAAIRGATLAASHATRVAPRRIGGAALRSREEARRERRGEGLRDEGERRKSADE